eukprot:TRINITY_DN1828_c0_g1_i2.p1 TRINITY_DN1828_c0_g1~~TRINITY_DN1828_c0_g1_i2.p1  ORF type:complete len:554 (+),score=118.34 TRINITY_DN1828_c0_g1_i2:148-1809(+)
MESGNSSPHTPPAEWVNDFVNNVYAFLNPSKGGTQVPSKLISNKDSVLLKASGISDPDGDYSDGEDPEQPIAKKSRKHRQHAARRSWSPELHQYFTLAWGKLCDAGIRPSPRKIMNIMRDNGAPMEDLTIRQVQSHHQKFKLKLAKQLESIQQAQHLPSLPPSVALTQLLASPAVVDAVMSPGSSPVLSRAAQLKGLKPEGSGSAVPPGFVASLVPAFTGALAGPSLAVQPSGLSSSSPAVAPPTSLSSASHELKSPPSPEAGALGGTAGEDEAERQARLLAASVLASAAALAKSAGSPNPGPHSAHAVPDRNAHQRKYDSPGAQPAGWPSPSSSTQSPVSSDTAGSSPESSPRDSPSSAQSAANEALRRQMMTLADVSLNSPAVKRRLDDAECLPARPPEPPAQYRPASPLLLPSGRSSPSMPHALGTLGSTNSTRTQPSSSVNRKATVPDSNAAAESPRDSWSDSSCCWSSCWSPPSFELSPQSIAMESPFALTDSVAVPTSNGALSSPTQGIVAPDDGGTPGLVQGRLQMLLDGRSASGPFESSSLTPAP